MTPTTLFNTYYSALCLYGSSIIRTDAEDLVMNVFKKLLEGKITIDKLIVQRLYTCVKNECLNYVLLNNNRKRREAQSDNPDEETVEQLRIKAEVARQIYALITKLPKRQRQVIIEHVLEGREYKDISAEYGISVSTLKNHCMVGMDKLRVRITKELVY